MALFKKPSTLEEVKRAYENLSDEDKKSFHQTIADRIHESVGEQEAEHGQEDSQSAEAREHEALGAEHSDGEGEVAKLGEKDDTPEEQAEDKAHEESETKEESDTKTSEEPQDIADNREEVFERLSSRLSDLEERMKGLDELKSRMEEYNAKRAERFGYGGKPNSEKKDFKDMSASELKESILKGKN